MFPLPKTFAPQLITSETSNLFGITLPIRRMTTGFKTPCFLLKYSYSAMMSNKRPLYLKGIDQILFKLAETCGYEVTIAPISFQSNFMAYYESYNEFSSFTFSLSKLNRQATITTNDVYGEKHVIFGSKEFSCLEIASQEMMEHTGNEAQEGMNRYLSFILVLNDHLDYLPWRFQKLLFLGRSQKECPLFILPLEILKYIISLCSVKKKNQKREKNQKTIESR